MISVEQIRALEGRIEKALAFIGSLKAENEELRSRLVGIDGERREAEKRADDAGLRVLELEEAAAAFKQDQLRIEEGIIHALKKLDAFEDLVLRGDPPAQGQSPRVDPPAPRPAASVARADPPAPRPAASVARAEPPRAEQPKAAAVPVVKPQAATTAPAIAAAVDPATGVDEAEDIVTDLPIAGGGVTVADKPAADELDIF
jgi:hypothetical protein